MKEKPALRLEFFDSGREKSGGPEDGEHDRCPCRDLVDKAVLSNDDLADVIPAQLGHNTARKGKCLKSLGSVE
jgi:hypothetical protein